MAIYGIGAYYSEDVSSKFIKSNIIGCGWSNNDAPELHQYISTLKVGDIVYIKSVSPASNDIIVKATGIIIDNVIIRNYIVECGRNVFWFNKNEFRIPKPTEKNNVRLNTLYEEYHPQIQKKIIEIIGKGLK